MMLLRNSFMFLIISNLILLSGCMQFSSFEQDYRRGTDGLSLSINGETDIELYPGASNFLEQYYVEIENKGVYDLNDNDLYLIISLDKNFLKDKKTNKDNIILIGIGDFNYSYGNELRGRSKYADKGDFIRHDFTVEGNTPPNTGLSANIKADLCYRYKTVLEDSICIDTRAHENKGDGCLGESGKYPEYRHSAGQGAPVRISSVEVKQVLSSEGLNSNLIITIDNPNNGLVSMPDSIVKSCLQGSNINKVELSKVIVGTEELDLNDCDYDGKENNEDKGVNIDMDNTKIICSFDAEEFDSAIGYLTIPLRVELDYGYHETEILYINAMKEDLYS